MNSYHASQESLGPRAYRAILLAYLADQQALARPFLPAFWTTWQKTWRDKGRQTMEWTAENQPSAFFAVCARLIGPEVKLTIEQQLPGNLSPADVDAARLNTVLAHSSGEWISSDWPV